MAYQKIRAPQEAGFSMLPQTEKDKKAQAFLQREQYRQQGIQHAQGVADASAKVPGTILGTIGGLNKAAGAARGRTLQSGAEQFASSLGQAGLVAGGGANAALRQAAMDRSRQFTDIEAGRAQAEGDRRIQAGEAGVDAAMAQLGATKFKREAGDIYEDRQRKQLEMENLFQGIVAQHQGFFGADEDAIRRDINALAEGESDPEMYQWILRRGYQLSR